MRSVKMTRQSVDELVRRASEHLRRVNPELPVKPEMIQATADKFGLPIGVDLNGCPVVRTLFVAAYAPEAHEQKDRGCDILWQKYQQLASLETHVA